MTDPRPRPKYGEYAPVPPASSSDSAGSDPAASASAASGSGPSGPAPLVPPVESTPSSAAAQPRTTNHSDVENTASAAAAPERKRRMWDVLLTSTLLFFGVVDVINTFGTVSDLGPALREGLAAQGVESFSSDAIASEAGGAANIVRLVVLVLAIVFSLVRIQRKRIAFWIPLVGALIAGIALTVAILVTVMSDPGFIAYVDGLQQQ